jgi:hypothetical protein
LRTNQAFAVRKAKEKRPSSYAEGLFIDYLLLARI